MNVNKRIISIILGLNITLFTAPMYAFAGWPEDFVVVENKEAVPLHSGEVYSRIDGDMTYKIEFQSQTEKITLKDSSSPTGAADWWKSTAILRGYYHSSKGAPVISWHNLHSSAEQKVVTLQLNAWRARQGVFSTKFENMENSHANIECTANGDIKVYILQNKFFRE